MATDQQARSPSVCRHGVCAFTCCSARRAVEGRSSAIASPAGRWSGPQCPGRLPDKLLSLVSQLIGAPGGAALCQSLHKVGVPPPPCRPPRSAWQAAERERVGERTSISVAACLTTSMTSRRARWQTTSWLTLMSWTPATRRSRTKLSRLETTR